MPEKHHRKKRINFILGLVLTFLLTAFWGDGIQAKTFTIGMVTSVTIHDPTIEGFKACMVERGYIEGENVTYIYNGALEPNINTIDAEIRRLMTQDIDLLLSVGTLTSVRAKDLVETDIPIIFSALATPIERGIVKSLRNPGGNITGIRLTNHVPKALEWLVMITPEASKVYLPYNPEDEATRAYLESLAKTADLLGIEIELHQVLGGINPADLPVETAESFLTINLWTAEKVGLKIPDDVLIQARRIIR